MTWFVAVIAAVVLVAPLSASARPAPDSFADLAARLTPAVVNISSVQRVPVAIGPSVGQLPNLPPGSPFEEFFKRFFGTPQGGGQAERELTSLGSGFIIDPDGYVVTNNHVVANADAVTVILQDDRRFDAKIVGRDPKTDLALLKIESDTPLPSVAFGDSDAARVGDWVLAIGNPFGLGGTVTAGIVSARARVINAGPFDDFIQTDAPINRGNSGGPLFDMTGAVVGINTAIFSPTGGSVGIGFAIPAALAEPVLAQLRDHGKVTRGWLGVQIQAVSPDIAESLDLDAPTGALVAQVVDGGPAERAGIRAGDLIVGFDGKKVATLRVLPRLVAAAKIGAPVTVDLLRHGSKISVKVEISEMPEAQSTAANAPARGGALGMTLATLDANLRARFKIARDATGALVISVAADSPAAEAGIQAGDLLVEVNQAKIETPEDAANQIAAAEREGRKAILLLVDRHGDRRFVAAPLAVG